MSYSQSIHRLPIQLRTQQRVFIDMRALVVLPPINPPLNSRDDQDDGKRDDAVVHVVAGHGELGGEDEEDCG